VGASAHRDGRPPAILRPRLGLGDPARPPGAGGAAVPDPRPLPPPAGDALRAGPGPRGLMGWLDGKRALVVGAGSGIGRAVLDAFAAEGSRVAAMEIDQAKCERLAAEHPEFLVRRGDATALADARAAVDACVRDLGGIDVLVNCVGIFDFYRRLADL